MKKIKKLLRKLLIWLGLIDEITIIIKDDLSGLESFKCTAQGFYIIPFNSWSAGEPRDSIIIK